MVKRKKITVGKVCGLPAGTTYVCVIPKGEHHHEFIKFSERPPVRVGDVIRFKG